MPSSSQLIALAVAVLPVLAPFIVALYKYLLGRLPAAKRGLVGETVYRSVLAAEQVYAHTPGSGQAKEAWVTQHATQALASLGVKVDPSLLKIILEQTVLELNAAQDQAGREQLASEPAPQVGFAPTPAPTPSVPVAHSF